MPRTKKPKPDTAPVPGKLHNPTEPNVEFDAHLVYAGMRGLLFPFGVATGMLPDDQYRRGQWLKKQPEEYRSRVVARIMELEGSSDAPVS